MAVNGSRALCSGALSSLVQNADLKQTRLLRRIDEFVHDHGLERAVDPPDDPRPTDVGDPPTELDLASCPTVIWSTGYRPSYRYLPPEAFDRRGRIAQDGGVCALPGLYVLRPAPPAASAVEPPLRHRRRRRRPLRPPGCAPGRSRRGRHAGPSSARRVRMTISSTGDAAPAAQSVAA